MAENNFLSGLKVDQFIKANNDQIKQTISSAFSDSQKSASEMIKLQKITVLELQKLNAKGKTVQDNKGSNIKASLDSTLKSIQKENLKISKLRDASMFKSLKGFFAQGKKSESKDPKSYFQKDDPSKKSNSLLDSIKKGIFGLLKKESVDKKGLMNKIIGALFGALGFLSKGLAIGGLAGFLLTGKKEFLFSTAKGVMGVMKGVVYTFNLMGKLPKIMGTVADSFSSIAKIGETIAKLPKILSTALKTAKTAGKVASKMGVKAAGEHLVRKGVSVVGSKMAAKATDKAAGNIAGKTAAKGVAKAGGKSLAKRIPVLGSIMGVGFGIARIAKGDILGGIMEFGSAGLGLIDLVAPGVGFALSLAMDGLILMRDLKMASSSAKPKESSNKLSNVATGKQVGDAYSMKSKPKSKVSNKRGLKVNLSKFIDKYNPFKKDENGATPIGKAMGGVSQALDIAGTEVSSAFNNIMQNTVLPKDPNNPGYHLNGKSVNVTGLNPQMMANFLNMSAEYKAATGKSIGINSAYRSLAQQEVLWNKYGRNPKRVAPPGKSMHNYGFAMDINSSSGNELHSMGLLKKYNFSRPMAHEPWHIEPQGLKEKYADVRAGTYTGGDSGTQEGDAYSIKSSALSKLDGLTNAIPKQIGDKANLPIGDIANKLQNVKPIQVLLSQGDIVALATTMASAMAKAIPTPKTNTIPMNGGGRGSI